MKFEVRFECYQYNSGAGDNGTKLIVRDFNHSDEAYQFFLKIKGLLLHPQNNESLHDFVEEQTGLYAGYLTELIGMYKIEETKCF